MYSLIKLLALCLYLPWYALGNCEVGNFTATGKAKLLDAHTRTEDTVCTWVIRPSSPLGSHEYLEISWMQFVVNSSMPECVRDYVEVFITKFDKSLGRFCSRNTEMTKPFNMYSKDGFAKLKFQFDANRGSLISLTYRIMRMDTKKDHCRNVVPSSNAGALNLFMQPDPNSATEDGCNIVISNEPNQFTKIVFMDFHLPEKEETCGAGFELRGSAFTGERGNTIYNKACGHKPPFRLVYFYRRIDFHLDSIPEGEKWRGVMVGIVRYGTSFMGGKFAKFYGRTKKTAPPRLITVGTIVEPDNTKIAGITLGVVILCIFIFLFCPVCIYWIRQSRRRKKRGGSKLKKEKKSKKSKKAEKSNSAEDIEGQDVEGQDVEGQDVEGQGTMLTEEQRNEEES